MEDSRNSVETEWDTGERDRAPGTVRKVQHCAYHDLRVSGASPAVQFGSECSVSQSVSQSASQSAVRMVTGDGSCMMH